MDELKNKGSSSLTLRWPYLIILGDTQELVDAKTGAGLVQWCPEKVAGQLRFDNCLVDLGVSDLSISEAIDRGVKSVVIGVAPTGGQINQRWICLLEEAAAAGLDIVSGLHCRLEDFSSLVAAAESSGARLVNVRTSADNLPIGTGLKRSGRRLLTVGTDCAIGKKYSALSITQCMKDRDINVDFRATGQTGIMITGEGVPIDTVMADFIAGASEVLSPTNSEDHWDIIEGQGSLFNPSYAGVSLGLLHGSQPDAIVVCHDPTREVIDTANHIPLPSVAECINLHLRTAKLTNPNVCCVGICVNTSGLDVEKGKSYLEELSAELGLPCVDPILDGCDAIVDKILTEFV